MSYNGYQENGASKHFKRRAPSKPGSNNNTKRARLGGKDESKSREYNTRYQGGSWYNKRNNEKNKFSSGNDTKPPGRSRFEGRFNANDSGTSSRRSGPSDSRYIDNRVQNNRFSDIPSRPKSPGVLTQNKEIISPVSKPRPNDNDKLDRLLSALPKGPKSTISRYNNGQTYTGTNQPIATQHKTLPVTFISKDRTESIYERVLQVGEGTYGKVYKARNTITNKLVALKKLRLQGEREGFPITSIREIKLLQSFNHPNVSTIKEIMVESQKIIYMIFEYADNDLSGLLLNKQIEITSAQSKHIFKQILQGIEYLHDNSILHRDIKGSNILIDNKGSLKITDFGLARKIDTNVNSIRDYTNRVITIWYRPPELLLGTTNYGPEVDMWGCGCLLVELYNKSALFQGTNELEQLEAIFKIMGSPTLEQWPNIFDMPWFFMVMPQQVNKYPSVFERDYKKILETEKCFDLAQGLLKYDQNARLTATQALECPYFKEDPQPEPLILDEAISCHEFEVKLARKQKRKEQQKPKS
ncbi:hypothetical protein RNJ44_02098 [Nakaseomyces bracarensis]|uniref:Protein kinase domain-containing protein n=1 Tax=Nakaseomyces bracarensis TaxID=273131 RepID=A0ABR4NMH3_9SACH